MLGNSNVYLYYEKVVVVQKFTLKEQSSDTQAIDLTKSVGSSVWIEATNPCIDAVDDEKWDPTEKKRSTKIYISLYWVFETV